MTPNKRDKTKEERNPHKRIKAEAIEYEYANNVNPYTPHPRASGASLEITMN